MPNTTASANMSLPVPIVGTETGPQYATDINSCMSIIDGHTHTSGSGVPITSSAININADLTFANNNAVALRSARFQSQSSPLALSTDKGCLYESGVDLYYNDGSGNQIRMTQSGSISGATGSISGLSSPAAATYVSGSSTFVWQSAANTPANLDCASVLLRNLTANSKALTLNPPAAMGANFSLTLPSLPASTKIVSIDSSGNIGNTYDVDNSTLQVSSSILSIKTAGVTQAKKEIRSTGTTVGAGGIAVSTSSGAFTTSSASYVDVTNMSVTITTLGNPVMLMMIGDGGSSSYIGTSNSPTTFLSILVQYVRGSTALSALNPYYQESNSTAIALQVPTHTHIDVVAAGTYTYKIQAANLSSGTTLVSGLKLVAYEL